MADVVRLRLAGPALRQGRLFLVDAATVLDRTRELMAAAACSTVSPRTLHGPKRPQVATDWLSQLQLAPPEAGSFVVKVVSDVPPALDPQGSLFQLDEEPFARRAVATLLRAVHAARAAADHAAATGEGVRFDAATSLGVSANLLESLAALIDAARAESVDVGVQWAAHRTVPPEIPDRVVVGSELAGVLREAGSRLRARAPTEDFELEGFVVRLDRLESDAASPGMITVAGLLQGAVRRVRLELGADDYRRAVEAHRDARPVRCLGTLDKEGRGFVLRDPHRFDVDPGVEGEA